MGESFTLNCRGGKGEGGHYTVGEVRVGTT